LTSVAAGGRRRRTDGLARLWTALAVLVLNTTLLLVLVNLGLAALFRAGLLPGAPAAAMRSGAAPGTPAYEAAVADAVARGTFRAREGLFPGRTPREVAALSLESRRFRGLAYLPYAQFVEGAYAGRFVHVDRAGFRSGGVPLPWPPEAGATNVFVFGDSTTFGDGLPDDATVPAALAALLGRRGRPVRVYNFGCAGYFSTQERVRFEALLVEGRVPAIAVFVDGIGDFARPDGEPALTDRLRQLMANAGEPPQDPLRAALGALPLARAATALRTWAGAEPEPAADTRPTPGRPVEATAAGVLARYLENKRQIGASARARGVRALFVWQPAPGVGGDATARSLGYAQLAARRDLGPDFAWCADVLVRTLDGVHYTPRTARRIARCIARALEGDAG
jgi:hypothetical protein